jgi:glycosyltransferase involved in cell wall biosynthesis
VPGGIKRRNLGTGHRRQQRQSLSAYLEQERPRALLAAGHRANLLAAQAGLGGTRIVLSVHNALSPGLTRLNPFRRWQRLSALRRYYPRADAIVCVSDGVATDLADLVPAAQKKITTVHNPVAPTDTDDTAPLHPWLLDERVPVILGAGRLTAQKDFATLIRAFALLQQAPNPRLLILGEGPEREDLLRLATRLGVADRVALPGFVSNPRAHMAAASVFVLSSRWEGFGNVLVEAMSSGTPVIATDCPSGPREILAHGEFGQLVPVGDHDALSAAIGESLARPIDAQAAQLRAAAFAPAQVAGRYLEVLLRPGDA